MNREFELEQQVEDLKEQVRYWRGVVEGNHSEVFTGIVARRFDLSAGEASILLTLYKAGGRVVPHAQLNQQRVARTECEMRDPEIVKVLVCKIRRRLGSESIQTKYGIGYSLHQDIIQQIDSIKEGGFECVSSSHGADSPTKNPATVAALSH